MKKQILLDLLIVIGIPLVAMIGYFYFSSGNATELLSFATPDGAATGQSDQQLGIKTKTALDKLNSIHFDKVLFTDPVFLSLEDYTVQLPVYELGRAYPFSPTAELQVMSRKSQANIKQTPTGAILTIPANANLSQKLDALNTPVK